MISPAHFIATSIQIEQKIGDLYASFAKMLADDADVSAMFTQLAEEEYGHVKALEFADRVLRGFKGKMEVNDTFEPLADGILKNLDTALSMIETGKTITADKALGIAVKLESAVIEEQRTQLFETDSEELLKTFGLLRDQTDQHKKRLLEFVKTRKNGKG